MIVNSLKRVTFATVINEILIANGHKKGCTTICRTIISFQRQI